MGDRRVKIVWFKILNVEFTFLKAFPYVVRPYKVRTSIDVPVFSRVEEKVLYGRVGRSNVLFVAPFRDREDEG